MLSLNVRGIRDSKKRKNLFCWLRNQNADIYFLQETYSSRDCENLWRMEWKGELFFAHGTNHSKGTLILFRDTLDFQVREKLVDENGRFIFLDLYIQGFPFLIVNIYAPTKVKEQSDFFKALNNVVEILGENEKQIIMGGDLNITFDHALDGSGGTGCIKDSVKFFKEIISNHELLDIWRTRFPNLKRFTWRQKRPLIQRRLDYWFISDSLQEDIEKVEIVTAIRWDHSAIILDINSIPEQKRGASFWKMNNSLLEDEIYIQRIKVLFPKWLEESNDVGDIRLKWDWVKYKIREVTISLSKKKLKRERRK